MSFPCAKSHPLTLTQSPPSPPPQPTASDDDSDGWYSAPEEQEELVEHYPTSLSPQTVPGPHTRPLSFPTPPIRPGDLTSTDESGSLCPTVESPVRLEPLGPGTGEVVTLLPVGILNNLFYLTIICIQIVASKHRNIRIVMCTPKILSCTRVKKGGGGVTAAQKVIDGFAFELFLLVYKKKKKKGHNWSRTHNLTHGRRRSKQSARCSSR